MTISKEIRAEWDDLKEKGDTAALAKILGVTPQYVSKIINTGEGPIGQIKKICKYFNARKRDIAKINEDDNN